MSTTLTPSQFISKVRAGEAIVPPVTVKGFGPGDIPGGYKAYESGSYAVNDSKYGAVGTKHLRPRTTGANPWNIAMGGGVLLENYNPVGYKTDVVITKSANGHVVISGAWSQATTILDSRGNKTFGQWSQVDTRIEFDVSNTDSEDPPVDPAKPFTVTAPSGVFARPESGTLALGTMSMSPYIAYASAVVTPSNTGLRVISSGTNNWSVSVKDTANLGKYQVGVKALVKGSSVTVYADGEIEITATGGTPEDPDDPIDYPITPDPPTPDVPEEPEELVLQKSSVETTALGDSDGNVEWVVVATTEADGTGSIEAEALPRRMISDYLPAPKIFRPVQRKSLKRSMTVEDAQSVNELGIQEKRVQFAGVDSWGALQQYAESALTDAARCVRGMATIPCNPLLRSGDTVNYDDSEWYVERAQHNFSDWTSHLTMRRVPTGAEISGVFFSSPGSAESAIVRVVKDATGRVNNAVEATVLQKLDARTYTVKVQNSDEIVTVKSDHVIFGDLIAGRTILIGRGTK
ncbi:MAG: hypothetical protein EOM93_06345 [Gammaproteobacteria bacterium]|nr:hypothetical protein [Gammaproteobacteria bacterium]